MGKQQRELMNLRSNLIVIFHKERKSVATLCDFPIKWSHCINNTSSIQYSKCVNRGERLARRWIRPAGSHMCGMYLSLQESLCTAAYTSAMTRPITLKAPDNVSAQQRSWWNDICLLRCTGTQVARPNALKLVSHPSCLLHPVSFQDWWQIKYNLMVLSRSRWKHSWAPPAALLADARPVSVQKQEVGRLPERLNHPWYRLLQKLAGREKEGGGGTRISYPHISSDNQFKTFPNSILGLLIPLKVSCPERLHISGRWLHLRLETLCGRHSTEQETSVTLCWSLQACP